MSLRHLAKGTSLSALKKDVLRLYSMHFCPYAQRTRLVLAHKQIPHELINVDLKYKPDWFVARNPLGLVPILEKNGQTVCESAVCGDFLDEVYPQFPLYPSDPWERAWQKRLIVQFEGVASSFGGVKSRNVERKEKALKQLVAGLKRFETDLTDTFFGGSSPGMADYHMWPWYERVPAIEQMTGMSLLPKEDFPRLHRWMKAMLQVPAVKATLIPDDLHMTFMMSFATGTPNYDAAFQANL